jgi:nucleotide-binding universal stress UspA family protein
VAGCHNSFDRSSDKGRNQPQERLAVGEDQELYGEDAAREAIRISIKELKKERARSIDHQIVEGSPAHALLAVAGTDPKNLIIVGNRGLGAAGEDPPVLVQPRVKEGNAAKLLIDLSEEGDVLVVGYRGRIGLAGLLLGSVSQNVAAHAKCTVVVAR